MEDYIEYGQDITSDDLSDAGNEIPSEDIETVTPGMTDNESFQLDTTLASHLENDIESCSENLSSATQNGATNEYSRSDRIDHLLELVLNLFDSTQSIHGLGEDSRRELELAVRLHNMPFFSGKKIRPHQETLQTAQSQISEYLRYSALPQLNLTPEEKSILAAVLALSLAKLNRKEIARLDLNAIQQGQALTLAALLRIAVGLDHLKNGETTIQKIELARDGTWIVVDGPQATIDAAAARKNASLWNKMGYPKIKVIEPAEAEITLQPFPMPSEQIGLTASDTFAEAGRKVMRYHFAQMLKNEEGTRLGADIEALHDMRVATRRLRAAFEVFEEAFEPGKLAPYLKGLRATGRALGSVRDLDVFMEKAAQYLNTLSESERDSLDPLLNAWRDQRENARNRMLAHLDSQEYTAFKRKFNVFLNTPGKGARQPSQDTPVPNWVSEVAPVLIYTRLASVRAFDSFLDNASTELLHALRIEFKKLRYTVEYFKEILGKKAEPVIDDLKALQDHLGDLNDAQVATRLLREFIVAWEPLQVGLPISERKNIEGVVNYMAYRHAELHRLMAIFYQIWKRHFNNHRFRRNLAQAISIL